MSMIDYIVFLLLFTTLAISIVLISSIFKPMVSSLTANSNSTVVQDIQIKYNSAETSFDAMLVLIFVGLVLGLIISVILMPFHPIFLPFLVILLLIMLFFAPVMSNLFGTIITSSVVSNVADEFPLTTKLFQNYPLLILGAFALAILFSLNK